MGRVDHHRPGCGPVGECTPSERAASNAVAFRGPLCPHPHQATMIKSAIIGCGARAIEHAASYERISDAVVWAVCDSNRERLQAFPGSIPPERRFPDVESLLAGCVPDLVHLVTPPTARLSLIPRLADAGVKAFIIEKPFACSLEEARQIVALCRKQTWASNSASKTMWIRRRTASTG